MIAFEKYLIEQGWLKHKYNLIKGCLEPTTDIELSTMRNIDYRYVHPIDKSKVIVIGIHYSDCPPTLVSPTPTVKGKQDLTGYERLGLLEKYDFETIVNAMFDKSIILEL